MNKMRQIARNLFLVVIALMHESCWHLMPNCTKYFNAYELPVVQADSVPVNAMNGFYVADDRKNSFYFRSNGMVKKYPIVVPNFILDLETGQYSSDFNYNGHKGSQNFWGAYAIRGDSILIQTFNYHTTEACKRSVFEYKGVVLNDTTILITYYRPYWFSREPYLEQVIYRYVPTNVDLDDSKAWFKRKRWYQNGVHHSRQ